MKHNPIHEHRLVVKALDLACKRMTRICLDRTCPIKIRRCMHAIPTDCAARMKAYLLRRAR